MMTHQTMAKWHAAQRTVLLSLGYLSATCLNAMITCADTLSLSDKRITLLSDRHGVCGHSAKQLESFVAVLEKVEKPLHLLVEQPPDLYYQYARTLGLLTGVTKRVRASALQSVTTENIEIRPMAWAAHFILSAENTRMIDPESHCNRQDQYPLKDITFQQVIDEFKGNKTMLDAAFALTTCTHMKHTYAASIKKANNALTLLKALMAHHHIDPSSTILAYKKGTGATDVNDGLAKAILDSSSPLIELNILHKIITSSHRALTLIAGYHNTSRVNTMLLDADARHLYHAGNPLGSRAITPAEFTKALTAQPPHTALIQYGTVPIACCLLAVIWYYCYLMNALTTT